MNRNDDFTRTLEAWLRGQAPTQAPDRVLEAALERVGAESQRLGWRQRLLGETQMATLLRAAALTAVVALAILVGLQFASLFRNVGPQPSPSEVTTPSESAAASPTATLPAGCINPPTGITTLIDLPSSGPLDPAVDPVACYGNAPLTFEATWYGGGVADCPTAPEPAWLACSSFVLQAPGDTNKLSRAQLFVAVDPSVSFSPSEPYAQVRVTGHYDDPAAQTCVQTSPTSGESAQPSTEIIDIIDICRGTFVVTQVVPLQ